MGRREDKMGILSNLFFGKSDPLAKSTDTGDAGLPKRVREWGVQSGLGNEPRDDAEVESSESKSEIPAVKQKIIPELDCTNVESNVSSDGKVLEVWLTLQNHTANEIEVKNITILNQRYGMNQFYKPNESREIKVFQGATPLDYHANKATIQLKIVANDDYFEEDFTVEYHQESYSGVTVWLPEELKPIRPIRDI